ncbi:MAG: 3-phosphoshikimate 1-carboxyvinyltransferase, partial [Balneolaceae bacterium]
YSLPIPSAQLKSCVLLAGLFGKDPTIVIETVQSRDHTERLLDLKVETFGADKRIISSLQHSIPAQNYTVPGDFSAASFWLAAGAIHPSSKIVLPETGINPSRTAFLTILKEMGANITLGNELMQGKEPVADITITSSELHAIELQPSVIANCIDELPILMIVMCFAKGTSVIRGAGELRHKETDRLKAMGNILSLAGADFEMFEDGIKITGNREFKPKSAIFESEHDHRIAMSAAVLSLMANENSKIIGAECTDISYPGFWRDLQLLIEQ